MSWKQIKIFTADSEQSVIIEPNPEKDGMVMHSIEEYDKKSFMLYMTFEEAESIGRELIKYAEEMIAANDRINNEFYVAPVYNYAVRDGRHIVITYVDKVYQMGTPEDLEDYLNGR